MAQPKQTPPPPIYTADARPIMVGMTLFGVDKNCRDRDLPKIEPLLVTQVDLGAKRQIRIRRNNGTEWTWTALKTGPCYPGEQLLYATFGEARSVAVEVAKGNVQSYESRVEREQRDLKRAKLDLDNAKAALANFKEKVSGLRKSAAPKIKTLPTK